MKKRENRVAAAIRRFVSNPVTLLVKGLMLFLIGISEASRTFSDDIAHGRLRVGHGLVIIGLFGFLESLPHLIEALEAEGEYLEAREAKRAEHREQA